MKYLLLILSLMIFPFSGRAQGGGEMFKRMIANEKQMTLDSIADLSDDQVLIIESIYEDYGKAIENNFAENQGNRDTIRSKMMEIRKEKNLAMEAVLNQEQYQHYLKMLEDRQQRFRNRNN